MKSNVRNALAAAGFVAATLVSSVALAVVESETAPGSNDSLATAQALTVVNGTAGNGTAEVTGTIGSTTYSVAAVPDVDFYSFAASQGDILTIDIGGGIKDGGPTNPIRSVDTVIALFSADGTMLYLNDDADAIDLNSIATNDSTILNAVLPATGTYFVGVVGTGIQSMHLFSDGGVVTGPSTADPNTGNGSYTLTISGVTTPVVDTPPAPPPAPLVQQINIDIRPRHPGVARIYPHSDDMVNVALLSADGFDALKVDRSSLTFGADGSERSLYRCHNEGFDVNRDGKKDLVCRFKIKAAGFDVGDVEGVLKGNTVDGKPIEGHAPLKIVMPGKKRKHQRDNERWERHADRR